MHEMSIADGVLRAVLAAANEHGATRVERVELDVGQMRLVVPEALQMAWQVISDGTIAAGSELVADEVPMQARCRECGRQFAPRIDDYLCPGCGQADVDIIAGDDIILKSVVCEGNDDASGGAKEGAQGQ
jgi:hydrogenase nickel incorporation protein HypA/HybF